MPRNSGRLVAHGRFGRLVGMTRVQDDEPPPGCRDHQARERKRGLLGKAFSYDGVEKAVKLESWKTGAAAQHIERLDLKSPRGKRCRTG